MAPTKRVYTLGHSNRPLQEFLEILKEYNIRRLVDVRRFPKSSKYPYFNRENLAQTLRSIGVDYIWFGDLLGGFRSGGYEEYMKTREYLKGIRRLIEIIEETRDGFVAIMCSERLWFKCHRRFIADTLTEMGYNVVHIVERNKVYQHKRQKLIEP